MQTLLDACQEYLTSPTPLAPTFVCPAIAPPLTPPLDREQQNDDNNKDNNNYILFIRKYQLRA